ncbi:hypothetical protein [Legionella taurinensis]|uniref:Uncharacterized protein n=1 Tax=Legionella taurinensis TaxID=70611 RepID=A0A3A5LD32_9GAMM|nr:hypothetical protein [Legionella taurinensis]RJT48326.1 hypothetical protein D6J04_04295 [Legionella taurinensis]RJT69010.1 hypothetical protein D6J03_02920 [Legionella taurinensis]STY26073.1 Uncharacterised protein [Legionella taurinensis]
MGRRASGKPFTTIADSGLGQFLNRLERKIEALQKEYANAPQSLELRYAKSQVAAVAAALKAINEEVLPKFQSGKNPGLGDWSTIKSTIEAVSKEHMSVFSTPEQAVIKAITAHFDELVTTARKAGKIKKINAESKDTFCTHFKAELRKAKIFQEALAIPGVNLESILKQVDDLVDGWDFSGSKPEDFKEVLPKILDNKSPYAFLIAHPMSYALAVECWYGLKAMPESIDELLSFLNPDALKISIPLLFSASHTPGASKEEYYVFKIEYNKNVLTLDFQSLFSDNRGMAESVIKDGLAGYLMGSADTQEGIAEAKTQGEKKARFEKALSVLDELTQAFNEPCAQVSKPLSLEGQSHASQVILLQKQSEWTQKVIAAAEGTLTILQQKMASLASSGIVDDEEMPEYFITSNPLKLVRAQLILKSAYARAVKDIEEKQAGLQQLYSRLQDQTATIHKAWYEAELTFHRDESAAVGMTLDAINADLDKLNTNRPLEPKDTVEQQIAMLKSELSAVDNDLGNLALHQETVGQLANPVPVRDNRLLQASYPALNDEINALYNPQRDTRAALNERIAQLRLDVIRHRNEVVFQLRKEQSALEFLESMRSTNIESIKQHYAEKQKQWSDEEKQLDTLMQKASEIDTALSEAEQARQRHEKMIQDSEEVLPEQWRQIKESATAVAGLIEKTDGTALSANVSSVNELTGFKVAAEAKYKSFKDALDKCTTQSEVYPDTVEADLQVLQKIEKCFLKNKLIIDFEAMGNIEEFKLGFFDPFKKSFVKLLTFLDAKSDQIESLWQFKQKQGSLDVNSEEYQDSFGLFQNLFFAKRNSLEEKAHTRALARAWQPQAAAFELEKKNFDTRYEGLCLLVEDRNNSEKAIVSLNQDISSRRLEQKKQEELVVASKKTIAELKPNVEIIGLIIQLTEGITELGGKINQPDAKNGIAALYEQYHQLSAESSLLLEKLNGIPNHQDYDANRLNIQKQLAANCGQLQMLARSLLNEHMEKMKTAAGELKNKFADLGLQSINSQSSEVPERLTKTASLLKGYNVLLQELSHLHEEHQTFASTLTALKDDVLVEEYEKEQPFAAVREKREEISAQLIKDSQSLLAAISNQVKEYRETLQFDYYSREDDKAQQGKRMAVEAYLGKIKAPLEQLQETISLSVIKDSLQESLDEVNQGISTLNNSMLDNKSVLEKSQQRISNRVELMDNYLDLFGENGYEAQRAKRFVVKDSIFSSEDATERKTYMVKLRVLLAAFKEKGDPETFHQLYALVERGRNEFPGLTLRPMLRRLLVALQEIRQDFSDELIQVNDEVENTSSRKIAQKEISGVLQTLYDRIDEMKNYEKLQNHSETVVSAVNNVSQKLKGRLDDFVKTKLNDEKQVTAQELSSFTGEMRDILRSEDDKMHSERSWFAPVVANIVAGLFTLGIALGIKLASSKSTQGYAAFFMDKTQREKNVDKVDDALEQLAAPAA